MDCSVLLNLYQNALIGILLACALLGSFRIKNFIKAFFKKTPLPDTNIKGKYAIVIPARNESKVIEGLLKSIKRQDYDQELLDVYVIVREEKDPTIEIAKRYGAITKSVYANNKSQVLNYTFKYMLESKKEYDALFIVDADNILKENYISEMNKAYQAGYPIGVGYRNNKEWNNGSVSACSALTFFMTNTLQNRPNNETNLNMVVSGTGYYISYKLIKEFEGWPFNTLTEDYELSVYCTINNIKIKYVESAEFLDEQPTSFKVSCIQRLRWVKGYLEVQKKYRKELSEVDDQSNATTLGKIKTKIGIWPFLLAIIGIIVYLFFLIVTVCLGPFAGLTNEVVIGKEILKLFLIIYISLVIFTLVLFLLEIKRINITFINLIKACLFNPIFLFAYVPLIIRAFKSKEIEWVPIAHTINKDDEDE